jgi:hypothetical protein
LYLNNFLTFHFSKSLSIDVIQSVENEKASIGFRSEEELQDAATAFADEERAWCVAVVKLLRKQAEGSGDKLLSIQLGR